MEQHGIMAKTFLGTEFNVQVLKSRAGFYLGTQTPDGIPVSRESVEYWTTDKEAETALSSGGWTQRQEP